MKYFIGVVPDDEIYNTILNIQKKFGDNRLEPHITLRPPVTVTEQTQWIEAIEMVCTDFSPFQIQLPSTGNFG
ncbi:MAG TPA: 2'-5' RNA ligase family protein, partial [Segetibacter sp.]|nr:2'-5' RNA ligase family protein [Segetibacter sp.]